MQECRDCEQWNALVYEYGPQSGAFLQSWEWGEFQKAAGKRVMRLLLGEAGMQVLETRLPLGMRYWFAPRGPFGNKKDGCRLVAEFGKQSRSLFVRVEPVESLPTTNYQLEPSSHISPPNTLITDLTRTYDDLRVSQHSKTRYNIGLAERKGVTIEMKSSAFEEAWDIFVETGTRGGFHLHPKSYYKKMLATLTTPECHAFLAVARYEGEVVAANIMVDFHGTRTYLHGASGNRHREVMAPFLLHWALMTEAKHRGMRAYDWWGVAPEEADETHPWAGITRFKLGFGGRRVDYSGTFDLTCRPLTYRLYEFLRKLRRAVR
jgi:lipid II:glycine glycyltransferase (peptidoglycan interpeptide bridge formation enzyme)